MPLDPHIGTKILGLDVPSSSPLSLAKFYEHMFGLLPLSAGPEEDKLREQFKEEVCSYIGGDWGREDSGTWEELEGVIRKIFPERNDRGIGVNRVSYVSPREVGADIGAFLSLRFADPLHL